MMQVWEIGKGMEVLDVFVGGNDVVVFDGVWQANFRVLTTWGCLGDDLCM